MTEFPVELRSADYNPAWRDPLEFAKVIPGRLSATATMLSWILSTQVYVDVIDTSHWNFSEGRELDFEIVYENGFSAVIMKSTQGNWFTDDKFDYSWRACQDNGLIPMTYHFFEDHIGGFEQAQWCLSNIAEFLKAVDGKTIIWDDVEVKGSATQSQRQNRAKAFNETIDEEGFLTGNYSSYYLWRSLMGDIPLSWVNLFWQWVAHWTPATSPLLPIGWTKAKAKFWQYGISPTHSWAKRVGTNGNVDVNRFYGTIQDLKDLLGITVPPPADCCEEVLIALDIMQKDIVGLSSRVTQTESKLTVVENEQSAIYGKLDGMQNDLEILAGNLAVVAGRLDSAETDIAKINELIEDVRSSFCPPA